MSYIIVNKGIKEVEEEMIREKSENMTFTNKYDESISLGKRDVKRGLKLTKEAKLLAEEIAKKLIDLSNSEKFGITEKEFTPFLKMVVNYHVKVIEIGYMLSHGSMGHNHKLVINKNFNEVLASQYCIAHMREINEYAEQNGIFIP